MQHIFLFFGIIAFSFCSAQTTDQIVQNGGFENGDGYPTMSEQLATSTPHQLEEKCNYWVGVGDNITPDWYTTQNLADALQGGCPIDFGSAADVVNTQPKIATHDGSLFYAGCGSEEHAINTLSRQTYADSKVKVSFWFAPRGVIRDTHVSVRLIDSHNSDNNLEIGLVNVIVSGNNPPYSPCVWYYFESDWVPTGHNQFDKMQIGGANNPAGAFTEAGYTYYDDVNLYNGMDCCPPFALYEDNALLSQETHVSDYIIAGFDAGIPDISGNVTVQTGQDVAFLAGNSIDLKDGFSVQPGATFAAVIHDCNPFTEPFGSNILVQTLPNVFTPNGDHVNDQLCFNVTGAQYYSIQIFNRWGTNFQTLEYQNSGSLTSNIVCTWDGGNSDDGTYYYIVTFSNCNQSITYESFLTLIRGSQRLAAPHDSTSNTITNSNQFSVYPNPTTDGSVTIDCGNLSPQKIEVYNSLGELISDELKQTKENNKITLEGLSKGFYYVRVLLENGIYESREIIVL